VVNTMSGGWAERGREVLDRREGPHEGKNTLVRRAYKTPGELGVKEGGSSLMETNSGLKPLGEKQIRGRKAPLRFLWESGDTNVGKKRVTEVCSKEGEKGTGRHCVRHEGGEGLGGELMAP